MLSHYRLVEKIGEGGMGVVWKAEDTVLNRTVAIKVLPADLALDEEHRRMFLDEARLAASVAHGNIVQVHELGREGDLDFIVMEYIEGQPLSKILPGRPLPPDKVADWGLQVAQGLARAHHKGLLHRDLKPANLLVTPEGELKIVDFGLATLFSRPDPRTGSLAITLTEALPGEPATRIAGTLPYMSPEQVRGEKPDARSDIFSFGTVLYEMTAGERPFMGRTPADVAQEILRSQPKPLHKQVPTVPLDLQRIIEKALARRPEERYQHMDDVAVDLNRLRKDLEAGSSPSHADLHIARPRSRPHLARWAIAAACVLIIGAAAVWYFQRPVWRNPLEGARFTRLTDFEGAEEHAAISRDGKFVAFLSDRDGTWDVWVSQVGTGDFHNLTHGSVQELRNPEVRTISFSPDASLVILWRRRPDSGGAGLVDGGWAVPTMGGALRPYLPGIAELDWSPDGNRIVYHPPAPGDPLFVTGAGEKSGQQIYSSKPGVHNHFPLWSPDAAFIYFVQGSPPNEMDIWRIRPTGGEPEQLTFHNALVSFPTFLDNRRLLYLATAEDGSGPWIHELNVERRVTRRISTGVEEYESLASSADGRRLVTTVSSGVAGLWRVPIADRVVHESDATRLTMPTTRGLSPRIGTGFVLYRAPKAGTDALWMVKEGIGTELWNGTDGRVVAGPAIAPDGRSLAFPVQTQGLTRLYVTNADGTGARRLAEELDVRGAPAWSPDGQWIAIAAIQDGEPRLYKIPLGGGTPVRLTEGYALDPLWSPSNRFLVYTGANVGATFVVNAVTPEGAAYDLPELSLSRGSRRMDFLAGGDELVVMKGDIFRDFWAVDLRTGRERQLTDLDRGFSITDFDISADGREIIFDRARDQSDIVLIDLAAH